MSGDTCGKDAGKKCPTCGLDKDGITKTLKHIYSEASDTQWADAAAGAHYALRELGHPDYQGEYEP